MTIPTDADDLGVSGQAIVTTPVHAKGSGLLLSELKLKLAGAVHPATTKNKV
jgi:hypothetical protein